MYKGEVEIPPLGMVDDLLCVSECGVKTTMLNSYINFKTNSKKLQFGVSKCKKIHVGKNCDDFKCQKLTVDSWAEVEHESKETGNVIIEDSYTGEEDMDDVEEDKYLGDIISNDGRNIKNIKSRVNKGKGIVTRIMTLLEGIPFGRFYFQVAVILRNSLLVSSMLTNSEAWYNLTKAELDFLETVDLMLMRRILKAPKSTPKEMLYLELGCMPFRNLIQKRRISFLYYLLHQDPKSMLYRFLETQLRSRNQKDWAVTVLKDLEELNLDISLDDIKQMNKSSFERKLKETAESKALEDLNKVKSGHSKVKDLKHTKLQMRNYFLPNGINQSKEESQLIFQLRSRMTFLKTNYKGIYDTYECSACEEKEENEAHILECKELLKWNKEVNETIEYENIYKSNVEEQVKIARLFQQNMSFKEKYYKVET